MEIKLINTQQVLSATNIALADYAINPYRNCEFSCLYCYGQENKNLKNKQDFISVKTNAPEILQKELRFKNPKRILLGSTTECFQEIEKEYKITSQILEILAKNNIPCTILTKSALIKNYLSLLTYNKANKIFFTLNIADDKIIALLETNSSSLKQRLETIEAIVKHGIAIRIHIGPFIPFLSILKDLFDLIPQGISEVDIELYHSKMGNFEAILSKVNESLGQEVKEKVGLIYKNEASYLSFAEVLKNETKILNQKYNFKIFFLVPDYNQFYNQKMDYEKALF